MKLLEIEVINFLAIGYAKVRLADRGLILVQGINPEETSADSNGSGKSSFADAISWCPYGITARGEDGDSVVNLTAGKDCCVSLFIQDGDDIFKIVRHRKHKIHKNRLHVFRFDADDVCHNLTQGTDQLTQKVVLQIMGCSHDVFAGAIYAGQERMPDLPGMTDKPLKMLIEEASGATVLEDAFKEASMRFNAAKAVSNELTNRAERALAAVTDAEERVEATKEGSVTFEAGRVERIRELIILAKNAREDADKLRAGSPSTLSITEIEALIFACDAAIESVRDEQTELCRKNTTRDAEIKNASRAETHVQNLTRQEERDAKALAALTHRVGCPCDTCARPFSAEDIAPAQKIASDNLIETRKQLSAAKTVLAAATARVKTLTDARDAYAATMTDISVKSIERASHHKNLESLKAHARAVDVANANALNYARQAKVKKDEPNPFLPQIEAARGVLLDRANALVECEREQEGAIKAVHVSQAIAKVFSPSGVRALLLDEVTPFLNDQTAKYLGTLSDGNIQATWTTLVKSAKDDLREKFSIEVVNKKGGNSFKLNSGGEKRKVRIACALALQDLVARRATKPIELFIGDEIDDALDEPGLERLTSILEEKARERGSVFVISHRSLRDWISQVMTVKKVDGKATIEETIV